MFDDGPAWEPGDDISQHQTAFATALRVPFLITSNPRWNYITGIVVGDDEGCLPTDVEVALVADLLRRYCQRYNQTFLNRMLERAPYDIDGGANLGYLIKRGHGDWAYRQGTWSGGPAWVPSSSQPSMTLRGVIARMGR